MAELDKDIFGDIPDEGTEPVEEMETETPTTTPVEEKPVIEEPAEEGDNTPTEEDDDYKERTSKRMKQLLKERAEERAEKEEMKQRLARLEQRESPQSEEPPEDWLDLYSTGNGPEQDAEAYKQWKSFNEREKAAWKAEALAELKAEESEAAQEQEQRTAEYESQMDELEETLGKTFDHNELMKAMAERPIWLTNGQPDWETKLEILEAKRPTANTAARKKLASMKPQGSVGSKGFATPEDLKGGWGSI